MKRCPPHKPVLTCCTCGRAYGQHNPACVCTDFRRTICARCGVRL